MPTPESEAFLRKKPTVPPTFEGVDLGNSEAVVNARDAIIREQWVQVMMARLVREEMGKCYHREGVNHLEKCGKYRGMEKDLFVGTNGIDIDLLSQMRISNYSNQPKFMGIKATSRTTSRTHRTRTISPQTTQLLRKHLVPKGPTSDSVTHWVPRVRGFKLVLWRRCKGSGATVHMCYGQNMKILQGSKLLIRVVELKC